jgi:hypothetical protein
MDPSSVIVTAIALWTAASAGWYYRKRRQLRRENSQVARNVNTAPLLHEQIPLSTQAHVEYNRVDKSYEKDQQWIRRSMDDHYQSRAPGA